jgi:transglutaminase-like putative cysteine protease
MELAVEHDTTYAYETSPRYSIQYLRLRPQQSAHQNVWKWRVTAPDSLTAFRDGFGNEVEVLALTKPPPSFTISVRGRVTTAANAGVQPEDADTLPPALFLRSTALTAADDALRDLAEQPSGRSGPAALAEGLADTVGGAIEYRGGVTGSATSAAQALAIGAGVCQDHTHVLLACCRARGIPARYVSGYYWGDPSGKEYEANHAWAEVFIAGTGWVGFDPANRRRVDDNYVRLAHGLDYLDAAPVRGMRRGGGMETLSVRVRVAVAAAGGQSPSQSQQ